MANQFSGDFSLKEVTLYNVYNSEAIDIKKLVLEINLYESVVSSALQAELLIQDIGQNLISSMPIVGQERIQIKIASNNKLYDLLSMPFTNLFGSYPGELTNVNTSPFLGSIATIAPRLFSNASIAICCKERSIVR